MFCCGNRHVARLSAFQLQNVKSYSKKVAKKQKQTKKPFEWCVFLQFCQKHWFSRERRLILQYNTAFDACCYKERENLCNLLIGKVHAAEKSTRTTKIILQSLGRRGSQINKLYPLLFT